MFTNYNKLNNYTGWLLFIISAVVYTLTVEETASFWDCGEFIAVSYKLEVPHPPGAPLFLLLGRMASFLASDVTQVAFWINMLSVISSAFTILFLFWSITHLAKKLVKEEDLTSNLLVIGSGVIGALSYTFSDSFWFSAVEAEVYGMSSFFTAFVVWAILKWEMIEEKADENRWMILIAYMVGLSIGVHLLNLVTLPALALIYYFKKTEKVSTKGLLMTLAASGLIIIVIMEGIIPGLPSLAGSIEIFFVNSLGLPFNSGIIFFVLTFVSALVFGIYYTSTHGLPTLNTMVLCFTFIIIGYSSYSIVLIRSNYNPPIDENNPEDVLSYVSYLKREQYGSRPLLHGPYYTAELVGQEKGDPVYVKGEDSYEVSDHKMDYKYDPSHTTILPRIYSSQGSHVRKYRELLGLRKGEKPSFADNLQYLFDHQLGTMYFRYFMWNFAGRQSDIQGAGWLGLFDSNENLPSNLENNKARNNFYMIPLILGIIGLLFHYYYDSKNFAFVGMLFFLTGAAIVLYLNSPPIEPRERDYIYAGSYYAFAFWIGLSVIAIGKFITSLIKNRTASIAIAMLLCLSAPAIMATEGWDDHDRSDRYFSVDSAKNFLASCAPNAIIFTGGDNDTFPLWYVQEVEGFRTDVRVIVLSYFNTDWYISQMMRDAYESKPLPFALDLKHYEQGGLNDYLPVMERKQIKGNAINASQFIELVKMNHKGLQIAPSGRGKYNTVPAKNLFLPVDSAVLTSGIIPERFKSLFTPVMDWPIKGRGLEKKDLAILDLIVSNNWERPIYFNNTSAASINFELKRYMVNEGNAFRLLPVKNKVHNQMFINSDIMYDNVMNNFHWRELNNPDVYYSEDYRHFVMNHRATFNTLIEVLMKEGKNDKAKEVILKSMELIPHEVFSYDHFSVQLVGYLIKMGEEEKAQEMAEIISRESSEMLEYLIEVKKPDQYEVQKNLVSLSKLAQAYRSSENDSLAVKYENLISKYYNQLSY